MYPPNFNYDEDFIIYKCLVYLGTLENMGIITKGTVSIDDLVEMKLSPSPYYTELIVKQLLEHKFLTIENDLENFTLKPEVSYTCLRIQYDEVETETILKEIYAANKSRFTTLLWKEIANWECVEFLVYHMEELEMDYKVNNKLLEVFYNLLDTLSAGQLTNMAYSSIESSLYQLRKGRIVEKYVFQFILDTISKKAERAVKEGYSYHNYGRNVHCPQSELSKYYHFKVLMTNENGFKSIPAS